MLRAESPILVMKEGIEVGRKWTISGERLLIGRGEDCDLVLAERPVSRHHAEIRREGNRYLLIDLDSKNGTCLNGQEIDGSAPLQDGDEIQIALRVKLLFVGADATVPLMLDDSQGPGLRLDQVGRRVWVNDQELTPPLSLAQYRVLELLYEGQGRVCSRDEIVATVWPEEESSGVTEQAIDALIRRLRDRLTELDRGHQYVVTVRGHGFRLENRE
ncbi:MAG: FHA domain-containing protein [Chloroflexota bacterium]